jgi:hypothetical protein
MLSDRWATSIYLVFDRHTNCLLITFLPEAFGLRI